MRFRQVTFLLLTVVLAGGCASVTRGTFEALVVESDPSGADVEIHRADEEFTEAELNQNTANATGALVGTTPSSFRLKRAGTYRVVVSKAGFETVESAVSHSVASGGAAGMAGNVLLGGVIGMVVDSSTGAMNNLSPNPLMVILAPKDASSDRPDYATEEPATDFSNAERQSGEAGQSGEEGQSDKEEEGQSEDNAHSDGAEREPAESLEPTTSKSQPGGRS